MQIKNSNSSDSQMNAQSLPATLASSQVFKIERKRKSNNSYEEGYLRDDEGTRININLFFNHI